MRYAYRNNFIVDLQTVLLDIVDIINIHNIRSVNPYELGRQFLFQSRHLILDGICFAGSDQLDIVSVGLYIEHIRFVNVDNG